VRSFSLSFSRFVESSMFEMIELRLSFRRYETSGFVGQQLRSPFLSKPLTVFPV